MANFPTHIAVGTVVSGALATVTVAADMVAPENIVAVTLAGVLGSVLPDIDLEDSRPGRAMFAGLGVFFSFAVLFSLQRKYSIAEMLVLWLGTLLFVRYVAKEIFFRISYHRGVWHSILAMIFCSFVTAWVYSKLLGKDEGVAWLAAGFLAIGYLTHLVLDELYSVDVMDTRIKASFGTALKLFDHRRLGHSAAMAMATVLVFMFTPSTKMFLENITSRQLWTDLNSRLLPQDKWFGGMAWIIESPPPKKADHVIPAATSSISTGSIPAPANDTPRQ
ncbi:MAG: metal-dependent hydrolase [Rhodospirillales bacterium]|nr:metal-dependent hydrolase [Rhodospirillales bacterium]